MSSGAERTTKSAKICVILERSTVAASMSHLPEGFSGLMRRAGGVVNERPGLNEDCRP
jgi:hypothetical protein